MLNWIINLWRGKLAQAERHIAILNDVIDELMKHEDELTLVIDRHHDVRAVHARCGIKAQAREWGKDCDVCQRMGYLAVAHDSVEDVEIDEYEDA